MLRRLKVFRTTCSRWKLDAKLFDGADDLLKEFESLKSDIEGTYAMECTLETGAKKSVEFIKQQMDVAGLKKRTGKLFDKGIDYTFDWETKVPRVLVGWTKDGWYGSYHERGYRLMKIGDRSKMDAKHKNVKMGYSASHNSKQVGYVKARPYLRPAIDLHLGEIQDAMVRELKSHIEYL